MTTTTGSTRTRTLAPAPECAACAAPGAEWTAALMMLLCGACAAAATGSPDRDPVRLGDILPVTAAALLTRAAIPARPRRCAAR
ncbi:hypothetical protein [Streptomyces sp. NRRL S-118]|uniref:hypothetical protein n=1 Tax=Streptomyces sp. NRRL S-118 TaxID=1463881 RepID=UPI000694E7D1|nr:hypothetical protein [Streptomyces sp. NRRL S-118]